MCYPSYCRTCIMEFKEILVGLFLVLQAFDTFAEQKDLIDFVAFANKAAVPMTGDQSGTYDLVNAVVIPNIADDVYIGIALSPLMNRTRYDETPEYRTPLTTSKAQATSGALFPAGTKVYYTDTDDYSSFRIRFTGNGDLPKRVGVFYFGAVLNGSRTAITNLPMHYQDANVLPIQRGITVSVGDATLTITVETNDNNLRWRKDGGTEITDWNDQSSVTINNVRLADAGLYECYVTDTREEGKHAFIVVHVRSCPASKWSSPLCLSSCPLCYNGGVCDVELGVCLCRIGFKGDNCEIPYGGNHFGFNGTVQCTTGNAECSGKLFCGQDPIGCGCASGWKDVGCSTECESGRYGNDCLHECHCADAKCDHSYGCDNDAICDDGFEGERCLTPVINECDIGFYGIFCNLECHCANSEACNRTNGSCPGSCEDGWTGSDCLLILPALYDAPSIRFRASSLLVEWTAWNQTRDIGNVGGDSYVLKYWKIDSADEVTTIDNLTQHQTQINISSICYNQTYSVTVSINTDVEGVIVQGKASPVTVFGPIDTPSFPYNPCSKYTRLANFSTTVTCDIWDYEVHTGMGVVQGYTLKYWKAATPDDVYILSLDEPILSQEYTILLPNVFVYYQYEVVVMVDYKHNETYMIGTPSSALNISKKKKVPTATLR